ncbi:hypothetical protein ACP70R_005713 [Stipagrostis hirtigluma subsp. patula]
MGDEVFAYSGPKHMMVRVGSDSCPTTMMTINWDSDEHRRCIAACLVQGTYVMECDQTRPWHHKALAPPWWESFHFRLREVLEHECECMLCRTTFFRCGGANRPWSIYGAILEHVPPAGARRHPSAPRYIVAFRGTVPRHPTFLGDMHLNLKILVNRQHDCGRFRDARRQVGELLDSTVVGVHVGSAAAVWLAGHSLGASIALDVGRDMMTRRGHSLPTFLFNPPQVSLAPGMLPPALNKVAKGVIYPTSYVVKAALGTTVLRSHERHMEEVFERLAPWAPELFVHERDAICRGFIDYFEQRQKMLERDRFRPVAEVAMKLSFRDMNRYMHHTDHENGKEQRVRPHLLPSARLWKSSSDGEPHGLQQWWQPDSRLKLSSRRYSYHNGA